MVTPLIESSPFPIALGPHALGPHALGAHALGAHHVRDELCYRLRQQSLLAEFSRMALQTGELQKILQRATKLCAWGLDAPFARAMEFLPNERRLVVRAGFGWAHNTADYVFFALDQASPAGQAYRTGQTVISNDLESDLRFEMPRLLSDYGAKSTTPDRGLQPSRGARPSVAWVANRLHRSGRFHE